jgi:hypothetical protein
MLLLRHQLNIAENEATDAQSPEKHCRKQSFSILVKLPQIFHKTHTPALINHRGSWQSIWVELFSNATVKQVQSSTELELL